MTNNQKLKTYVITDMMWEEHEIAVRKARSASWEKDKGMDGHMVVGGRKNYDNDTYTYFLEKMQGSHPLSPEGS